MIVSGVHYLDVDAIIIHIGTARYMDNLVPSWRRGFSGAGLAGRTPTLLNQYGTRWRGTIGVYSSRQPGARRSWSGRRLAAPCWHVYRDVIREILREPGRRVTTSMARYTSENFEDLYPATGHVNIGSRMEPRKMPDLCECDDRVRDTALPPLNLPFISTAPVRSRTTAARRQATEGDFWVAFHQATERASSAQVASRGYVFPRVFMSDEELAARIDLVLSGKEGYGKVGTCLSCGSPTGSDAMNWCSSRCSDLWNQRQDIHSS